MSTSKTIVFFGTDEFSAISLRRLLADGYLISTVVTKPDSRKGRGKKLIPSAVKEIALQHNITVLQPLKMADIADDIRALDSPIGVLVSYGKIIPQSIIDLFSPGIINVHPSLLPLYRGPSPIETAILNGDTKTGVSIMQLSAAMDAGPVYNQIETPLSGTEDAITLTQTLGAQGAAQLSSILGTITDGTLTPTPQDDTKATYCHLLQKEDAFANPASYTAQQLDQKIRAHLVFPKTKLTLLGHTVVVTKAAPVDTAETPLDIICSDKKILRIQELIGPSGKKMTAQAFLNGYSHSL